MKIGLGMCGRWSHGLCHSFSPLNRSSSSNIDSGNNGCEGTPLKGLLNEQVALHQSPSWSRAVGLNSNGNHDMLNGTIQCRWSEFWNGNRSRRQPWRWTSLTWKDRSKRNDSSQGLHDKPKLKYSVSLIHAKLCDGEFCRYEKFTKKSLITSAYLWPAQEGKKIWKKYIYLIFNYTERIN